MGNSFDLQSMMTASLVRVTLGRKKLATGLQQLNRVTTTKKKMIFDKYFC
jgi:hypothetical protein